MSIALLTDLYELTMGNSYLHQGLTGRATFDVFVRTPVPHRRFLVFAGLETVLNYLENLQFTEEDIGFLRTQGLFSEDFLELLRTLRFEGEVWAMPEGTLFFPNEPVLRVTAPRIQAQLIETFVLNAINYQTAVASKAARILLAVGPMSSVVDYSPRRDHGVDAAMYAARSSYLVGFHGSSNVEAGRRYGIPLSGTMAHAYVMSFSDELAAFRAFVGDHPRPVLLIDTYDTIRGAEHAVRVARELRAQGRDLAGVRLDSGELAGLSCRVRDILDEAGFPEVGIFTSGDLDEYRIQTLRADGACIQGYGVGTRLGVSWDVPALGGVYKLSADHEGPKLKLSSGKTTLPGAKQVWRTEDRDSIVDTIGLTSETLGGQPLLERVMYGGRRQTAAADLARIRDGVRSWLFRLPAELGEVREEAAPVYPVRLSKALSGLRLSLQRTFK